MMKVVICSFVTSTLCVLFKKTVSPSKGHEDILLRYFPPSFMVLRAQFTLTIHLRLVGVA